MSDTILKLEDITKIYPNGTVANRNINIELRKGEIHSIVGENGAGKSTLMKIIFAIEKQTSGKIYYKGEEINYQDFQELKLAIESLGGEYEKERDFSNDKVYRKIMEQKKGMKS